MKNVYLIYLVAFIACIKYALSSRKQFFTVFLVLFHLGLISLICYQPISLIVILVVYIKYQIFCSFELNYHKTETNVEIIKRCPTLKSRIFRPTIWIPPIFNGPFNTIFISQGMWTKYEDKLKDTSKFYEREDLDVGNNGVITMDWVITPHLKPHNNSIVLIMGGCMSPTNHNTQILIAEYLQNEGYQVIVTNIRGVSNDKTYQLPEYSNYLKYPNSDKEDIQPFWFTILDFEQSIISLKKRFPNKKLYCIGLSYGGCVLTNYICGAVKECLLDGAITLCSPINLIKTNERLLTNIWFKKFVQPYFRTGLINFTKLKKEAYTSITAKKLNIDFEKCIKVKTFMDFDEFLTRRMFGFQSLHDYYNAHDVTLNNRIHKNLKIPLLCITFEGDFFVNSSDLPKKNIKKISTQFILNVNMEDIVVLIQVYFRKSGTLKL